jgi:hypothetical protein
VLATHPTHLIVDINGYFAPPGGVGGLDFYTLTPCRILDTRNEAGPFGGPRLEATETGSFAVLASGCGIPVDARAYSLNATLVPPAPVGFLTLWGSGAIVAVAAITPAGTNGAVTAYVTNPANLILDVNGYFR